MHPIMVIYIGFSIISFGAIVYIRQRGTMRDRFIWFVVHVVFLITIFLVAMNGGEIF